MKEPLKDLTFPCTQAIETYLKDLYVRWQNPNERNALFGNLPIMPTVNNGFTTECPPIPWMGNITTAEYAIVSLEPLLDPSNFPRQVAASSTYDDWRNFYFENYFDNFFGINGINPRLTSYWGGVTKFFKRLLEAGDNPPLDVLNRIVEIPFCQYHAKKHPVYKPNSIFLEDFEKRITFFLNCNKMTTKKIIVLGKLPFQAMDQLGDTKVLDLLVNEPAQVTHKTPRTLRVKSIYGGCFFMRNAPFSNGWALTEPGLTRLSEIIRDYPCV